MNSPVILAVAPNGARKTKADHPALPITADEVARCAAECREANASMLHLHIRDKAGRHSLDADGYKATISAVRRECGAEMVIQATSEAGGIYSAAEQMAMVRAVKPEAVSLAVREIVPDAQSEAEAAAFLAWVSKERISPQFILYAPEDVQRFDDLKRRGVIPPDAHFRLYVLGRYAKDQTSSPSDLLTFMDVHDGEDPWAVCAFGPRETACGVTAACLGGHVRVGYENNFLLPDGTRSENNAELVAATATAITATGCVLASGMDARALLGMD